MRARTFSVMERFHEIEVAQGPEAKTLLGKDVRHSTGYLRGPLEKQADVREFK
ncbi:MAG: hypothetical protein IPL81_06790 [Flavobacteriales bacterium]|jgi:hypothetical protein|nr:hypothetical protein [Flavobacteriales bacterium]MBK9059577.1 hypothetical protein [Flavobacteriales bacterium]